MLQTYTFTLGQLLALAALVLTTGGILGVAAFIALNAWARTRARAWVVADQAKAWPVDDRGIPRRRAEDLALGQHCPADDAWHALIGMWLERHDRPSRPTTDEILERALGIGPENRVRSAHLRVASSMSRHGWANVRERTPEGASRLAWVPTTERAARTASVHLRGPTPNGVFTLEHAR